MKFADEDEDLSQYFVSVEQRLILETSNLPSAVFLCIVAHYIFNLSYHRKVVDVFLFLQEKVAELPTTSSKRNPSASSHFSGISRIHQQLVEDWTHIVEDNTLRIELALNCTINKLPFFFLWLWFLTLWFLTLWFIDIVIDTIHNLPIYSSTCMHVWNQLRKCGCYNKYTCRNGMSLLQMKLLNWHKPLLF